MAVKKNQKKSIQISNLLISMLIGLIINFIGIFICKWLNLPMLGDSVGTIMVSVYFGPAAGMVVASITALITCLLKIVPCYATIAGVSVGLIAGLMLSRKTNHDMFNMVTVAMLSAFVSAIICTILDISYFSFWVGNYWGSSLQSMLLTYINNDIAIIFMAELFVYISDRVISVLLAFLLLKLFRNIYNNISEKRRQKTAGATAVILVLCITLSLGDVVHAQDSSESSGGYTDFEFKTYGYDSGLLSSQINAVIQSSDGYIWVGSYSGLYRYDGINFENAYIDDRIRNVMSLFEDSKGRMWIGTNDSGAFCFDPETGECVRYYKDEGLDSGSIRGICEDTNGNIYLGSMLSLARVSPDGKLKIFEDENLNYSRYLSAMDNGCIAGVTSSGVLFVIKDEKVIDMIDPSETDTEFREVECHGNEIIAGSKSDVVTVYKLENNKLKVESTFSIAPLEYVNDLLYSPYYNGYFISCKNGISFCEEKSKKLGSLEKDVFKGEINAAAVDNQGNIWFASSKDGIIKYSHTPFENIIRKAGLTGVVTNSILIDGDDIYIGTDNGLQIINKKTNTYTENSCSKYLNGVRIRNLFKDSKGNIWISTYGDNELIKYSPDGKMLTFTSEKDGLKGKNARQVIELSDGRILVSCSDGLTYIKDDKVDATIGYEDGLEITTILSMIEKEDGTIMAASDGAGIYLIKDDKIVGHIGEKDGLETEVVMRIVKGSQGYFYVTSNAIYYDDGNKIKILDAFYSNDYDIIIDDGRCWIPSSAGLFVGSEQSLMDNDNLSFTLLDASWGLTTIFNANSWNVLDGDKLYLCCLDGVRRIAIDDTDEINSDFQMHLKYISTKVGEITKRNGSYVIPPAEGRIEFNIAINNYTLSNPIISYYLEGREGEGVVARQDKLVPLTYSHLRGGDYTLCIEVLDPKTLRPINFKRIPFKKEKLTYEKFYFQIYLALEILFCFFYVGWLFYVIHRRTRRIIGLQKEMTTDPMTGILNKAGSHRALKTACEEETGIFLMIDLDSFKLVNDLYGHDMGDKILIRFAELLKEGVNEDDICGRLGGDEFVAFIKNTIDEEEVEKLTVFMNKEIVKSAKEYMGDDMQIPLGTSIGAVRVPDEGRDFEEVFKLADKALYVVKQNGKHGYYIYQKKAEKKGASEESGDKHDLSHIKKIIGERNEGKGAYEVNFDKLQTLYKFVNRDDKVAGKKSHIVRISINSGDGKAVSDEALEAFKDVLIRGLGKNDVVSYYSGDIFALIMEDAPKEKIDEIISLWKEDEAHKAYTADVEVASVGE